MSARPSCAAAAIGICCLVWELPPPPPSRSRETQVSSRRRRRSTSCAAVNCSGMRQHSCPTVRANGRSVGARRAVPGDAAFGPERASS
jgi:hypothetical protein